MIPFLSRLHTFTNRKDVQYIIISVFRICGVRYSCAYKSPSCPTVPKVFYFTTFHSTPHSSMQAEVPDTLLTAPPWKILQPKMVKARCRFCDVVDDASKLVDPCR